VQCADGPRPQRLCYSPPPNSCKRTVPVPLGTLYEGIPVLCGRPAQRHARRSRSSSSCRGKNHLHAAKKASRSSPSRAFTPDHVDFALAAPLLTLMEITRKPTRARDSPCDVPCLWLLAVSSRPVPRLAAWISHSHRTASAYWRYREP
jgi:hypothetical protein